MKKRSTRRSKSSSRVVNDLYVIKNVLMKVVSDQQVIERVCRPDASYAPPVSCDVRRSTKAGTVPARTLPSISMTMSFLV